MKLESFYTQPICSATRSSIMSGRYVTRTGFQHMNVPLAVGALPLKEKTLPQYLKEAGYKTNHVGKWHRELSAALSRHTPVYPLRGLGWLL